MSESVASVIVMIAGAYLGLGLLFAMAYVLKGVQKSDPAAQGASWGFRLIIIPGVMLFWPLLASRWMRGMTHPPEEKSPHRTAAQSELTQL